MRICIRQSNSQSFDLIAGLGESEFDEDFKINGQRVVQIGEYLRAENSRPFNRGNRKTTVSWAATKEHGSFAAAEAFLLEHETDIPDVGALVCIAEGSGQTSFVLSDAQLQTHDGSRIGVSTLHKYLFVGGRFSRGDGS